MKYGRGMKVNAEKIKVMVLGGTKDQYVKTLWREGHWSLFQSFKYSGFVLGESSTDGTEYCRKVANRSCG